MVHLFVKITAINTLILIICLTIPALMGYDNYGNIVFIIGSAIAVAGILNFVIGMLEILIAIWKPKLKNMALAFLIFGCVAIAIGYGLALLDPPSR